MVCSSDEDGESHSSTPEWGVQYSDSESSSDSDLQSFDGQNVRAAVPRQERYGPVAVRNLATTLHGEIQRHLQAAKTEATPTRWGESYPRHVARCLVALATALPGNRERGTPLMPDLSEDPRGMQFALSILSAASMGKPSGTYDAVLRELHSGKDEVAILLKEAVQMRKREDPTFAIGCLQEFRKLSTHMGRHKAELERKVQGASLLVSKPQLMRRGKMKEAQEQLGLSYTMVKRAAQRNEYWLTQPAGNTVSPPNTKRQKRSFFTDISICAELHKCPHVELDKDRKLTYKKKTHWLDGKKVKITCEKKIIQGSKKHIVDWFLEQHPGSASRSRVYRCICPCMKLHSGVSDCACTYCWVIVHKQVAFRLMLNRSNECDCPACAQNSSWRRAQENFHELRRVIHPCGKAEVPGLKLPHEPHPPRFYRYSCCRPQEPPGKLKVFDKLDYVAPSKTQCERCKSALEAMLPTEDCKLWNLPVTYYERLNDVVVTERPKWNASTKELNSPYISKFVKVTSTYGKVVSRFARNLGYWKYHMFIKQVTAHARKLAVAKFDPETTIVTVVGAPAPQNTANCSETLLQYIIYI